ncbi:hypothetical protein JCM19052_5609 [Vibrio sp. JCM 19052]|nr:hypothetical protein JCM19052_5609 [Vibrio sp. JCM 19052]
MAETLPLSFLLEDLTLQKLQLNTLQLYFLLVRYLQPIVQPELQVAAPHSHLLLALHQLKHQVLLQSLNALAHLVATLRCYFRITHQAPSLTDHALGKRPQGRLRNLGYQNHQLILVALAQSAHLEVLPEFGYQLQVGSHSAEHQYPNQNRDQALLFPLPDRQQAQHLSLAEVVEHSLQLLALDHQSLTKQGDHRHSACFLLVLTRHLHESVHQMDRFHCLFRPALLLRSRR